MLNPAPRAQNGARTNERHPCLAIEDGPGEGVVRERHVAPELDAAELHLGSLGSLGSQGIGARGCERQQGREAKREREEVPPEH